MTRAPRLAAVLLVALAACSGGDDGSCVPRPELVLEADGGSTRLTVEIADSELERRRGLMGRASLGPDHGMVFLFDGPTEGGFWMKDTLVPLSIAFWDEDERIVAMLDMQPCRKDPCQVYLPNAPYVGAVEANVGYFERHGVEVGDGVRLVSDACR